MPPRSAVRASVISLTFLSLCSAQRLTFGIVGGITFSDSFQSNPIIGPLPNGDGTFTATYRSDSHAWIVGPKIEVKLSPVFSVEVNALYRNWSTVGRTIRYSRPIDTPFGSFSGGTFRLGDSQGIWQFPILLKYRLPIAGHRVFVEGGPSFRATRTGRLASAGGTVGAGAAFHRWNLSFEPTVRYTRWANRIPPTEAPLRGMDVPVFPFAISNPHQVEFLLGISPSADSLHPRLFGGSLGVLGGFSLTEGFPEKEGFAPYRSPFVGISFEHGLHRNLSIEIDGIYHPLVLNERMRATVLTWVFPVLARYHFGSAKIRPFVEGGPSFRIAGNTNDTNPSHYGITAGVGTSFRIPHVTLSPVLRYTRWAADAPSRTAPNSTNSNQLQLLFGFSF